VLRAVPLYSVAFTGPFRICYIQGDSKVRDVKYLCVPDGRLPFHDKCSCVMLQAFSFQSSSISTGAAANVLLVHVCPHIVNFRSRLVHIVHANRAGADAVSAALSMKERSAFSAGTVEDCRDAG
jgi:hypothetical protein